MNAMSTSRLGRRLGRSAAGAAALLVLVACSNTQSGSAAPESGAGVVSSGAVSSGAVSSGAVSSGVVTTNTPAGPSTSPSNASRPATGAPLTLPAVGINGVNDPACRSDRRPVILLHGTFSQISIDFAVLAPALIADGLCVYGANYGLFGTAAVGDSAMAFAAVLADVRAHTGAEQVDAVGFSQGGLVLRTALRRNGLAGQLHTAVLISPSFHGTDSPLIASIPGGACPACSDQAADSALIRDLNAGGDLDGAVRYAVAVTSGDLIVTPWRSQIPVGPPDRVRTVVLNEVCPQTNIRHQDMPRDSGVVGWAAAALTAAGEIDPADLVCTPGTG